MKELLVDAWGLLHRPEVLLELLAILAQLALAGLIANRIRKRGASLGSGSNLPAGGMMRLAFPLVAVLFLSATRFLGHHFGWHLVIVAVAVQLLIALGAIRMAVFALRRAFPTSLWVPGLERGLASVVWLGVALDAVGVMSELTEWLDGFAISVGKAHLTLWTILQGGASVLGTLLVALWLGGIIEARLAGSTTLDTSLKIVLSRISKTVLVLVAILVGMSLVGLDITTLSVFGGALGVGLGFGMQKIASNYVSGFIILLDHSIRIGHLIQVGQDRGEVKQITTRFTVLKAGNGSHFLVPNETLVASVVQNDMFADPRVRVAIQVQVGYTSDIDRALVILEELASAQVRVIADPKPQAFVVSLDDSAVRLELAFWIADPDKGSLELRSAINRGILQRFRQEGIEIPFPQREVRLLGGMPAQSGAS